MADHATLYCFTADRLEPADVDAAAPASGLLGALLRRGPHATAERGADGEARALHTRLGGVDVRVNVMPASERARHLAGLQGYLLQRCEVLEDSLPGRVPGARMVLGLVFEPAADEGGACDRFVAALARRTGALVFWPDGTLADPEGQVLAFPAAADDEHPLEHEEPGGEPPAADGEAHGGGAHGASHEEAYEPPTAERVARRLLAVLALAWRAWLEEAPVPEAQARLEDLRAWLEAQGLLGELEPEELALLRMPPGSWRMRERIDRSWAGEGAAVLAWALGLVELPPHDTLVDPQGLWREAGLLDAAPAALRAPSLRPPAEREWLGRRLLGLHWRLRDFTLRPHGMDYARFARECWFGGFDLAGIPLAAGDLAVDGAPLAAAPPEAVRRALSIALERHRAINWLEGQHPLWSEVDTST
jgi:hypothetical protein